MNRMHLMAIGGTLLLGCPAAIGSIDGVDVADAGPDRETDTGGGDRTPLRCETEASRARSVLEAHCTSCHGPATATAGFGVAHDAEAMREAGFVVPLAPSESRVYLRLASGSMPPATVARRPTDAEIRDVAAWIECGAVDFPDETRPPPRREYLDIDAQLALMRRDLTRQTLASDRPRIRYLSLAHLANAGLDDETITGFRMAVSLLVNSLSFNSSVTALEAIDPQGLLLRLDLRDFEWSAETWERLVADYPYAVRYDPDSLLFPIEEGDAEVLRRETRTEIPYVQADWLVTHASQAPLYYEVLDFAGRSAEDIALRIAGVDIVADEQEERVLRAGFAESGVSVNNRVIQRHEQPGRRGGFWVSFDFAGSDGDRSIFAEPIEFAHDGGEYIFSLPNGLQAYYIADEAGRLLDKAPREVVADFRRRDVSVTAGLSCMGCHDRQGIIPRLDEVRGVARDRFAGAELESILALYVEHEVMDRAMEADRERFRAARSRAGDDGGMHEPVVVMALDHERSLGLARAATTLGISEAQLRAALNANPSFFNGEIVTLRQPEGIVRRDAFDAAFASTVCALGLGQPCRRIDGVLRCSCQGL
ncbi:MAG: hypothetical protein KF901_29545 [Myxococcales bacterium]|nr:hypothetical protein [Myxococcales bacterium]